MSYRGPVPAQTVCKEPTLAVQSAKDSCDVNLIVKSFERTGAWPVALQEEVFADLSALPDFQSVQNQIARATAAFEQLPAHVRSAFNNSVAEFVDEFQDDAQREKFERLGLVEKAQEAAPVAPAAAVVPPVGA